MTGQACLTSSTRPRPDWAPRSSPRWFRTCADGSPGVARSRTEPVSGSSHGFGPSNPARFNQRTRCISAGATGARIAAFEGTAFVFGKSAPDSGVLAGLDCPFQAGLNDLAATADGFCVFDLEKSRAGVPDREEHLRVLVEAASAVAPSHQDRAP